MATSLESLIESTLNAHWRASVELTDDGAAFQCQCGFTVPARRSGHGSTTTWSPTHQARAVLAAISEAGAVEWGVAIVAEGFNFAGCTQQNDAYCACATWEEQECSLCAEAIEDGQLIYSLTRRGNPALPDDDENQWHDHFFKHAECPAVEG